MNRISAKTSEFDIDSTTTHESFRSINTETITRLNKTDTVNFNRINDDKQRITWTYVITRFEIANDHTCQYFILLARWLVLCDDALTRQISWSMISVKCFESCKLNNNLIHIANLIMIPYNRMPTFEMRFL